jgi:hypothetical protein
VGPQRVWLRDSWVPGLAMSRAIGDAVAHSVGVSPGGGSRAVVRVHLCIFGRGCHKGGRGLQAVVLGGGRRGVLTGHVAMRGRPALHALLITSVKFLQAGGVA